MKDLKVYIIILLVLGGGYLYFQFTEPAEVDWRPTYVRTDKIPYGTYILHEQVSDWFESPKIIHSRKPVYNTLVESKDTATNYLFINNAIEMDTLDYDKLTNFIEQGNDVFIATNYFGGVLQDSLGVRTEFNHRIPQRRRYARFANTNMLPEEHHHLDTEIIGHHFADFDTVRAAVLALNGADQPVYLRYTMGDGNLYLVASPDYFVNFSILDIEGETFSAKALSYLSPKPQLIWDDYQTLGPISADSPFRFFLNDPHLRPAYLLALFGMLIYLVYGIKRTQRIIPVVEPLQNTSIEFAKVVSSVYFQQRDHLDILQKKATYFMEHIRSAYRIRTDVPDPELAKLLSEHSGVEPGLIRKILQTIRDWQESPRQPSDQELMAFNHAIEKFHQNETHGRTTL